MGDSPVNGSLRGSGSAKQLRNVKRPRPLKMVPGQLEEVLEQVQQVEAALREKLYDLEATRQISRLSKLLKQHGAALECYNKEAMNRLDTAMRVACRDPELDLVTRLYTLELVELRQNGWSLNDNILAYYRQKLAQVEQEMGRLDMNSNPTTSGPFSGPGYGEAVTATKQYMPTMTGDCAINSSMNQGPDHNSEGRITTVVIVGSGELIISGTSEALVNSAKEVLEGFFSIASKPVDKTGQQQFEPKVGAPPPEITYDRNVLLQMAQSPLCSQPPAAWDRIVLNYPGIVKREGPTSKHFLREMASLRKQEAARQM